MELNWPASVVILGLFALLTFRRQLGALLDRTEKVKDWVVAPKQSTDSKELIPRKEEDQAAYERLTRGLDNQLLVLQDAEIEKALQDEGLKVHSAAEKVLVRHLSAVQLAFRFERISGIIYASQIQALRWLNSQNGGVEMDALLPFYDLATKRHSALYQSFEFEDWFDFFVRHELVTDPDVEKHEFVGYRITHLGRGFLRYLVDSGRVEPSIG